MTLRSSPGAAAPSGEPHVAQNEARSGFASPQAAQTPMAQTYVRPLLVC
jgi:hypothetical protein